MVLSQNAHRFVVDVRQQSARNILVSLSTKFSTVDFISTYAPQACHTDPNAAEQHYAELQSLLDLRYAFSPRVILGDFNARLIKALPYETAAIGPYTLGALSHELDTLSDAQLENRSKFVEFCLSNQLVAKNTFFMKPEADLVTYRAVGVKTWQPPWQLHKYAQMDFVLINDKWKNAITNVYSSHIHTVETDHKLMVAHIHFKLKTSSHKNKNRPPRFHQPTPEQIDNYNRRVAEHMHSQATDLSPLNMDQINKALMHAAAVALPRQDNRQKKDYISHDTWVLLERKWDALTNMDHDLATQLNTEITRKVRADKEKHLLDQLEQISSQGYKWDGLKKLRAKFTPSLSKFKDLDGNHVPYKEYPQKAADYLEKVQWGTTEIPEIENSRRHIPLQNGQFKVSDEPFTQAELDFVFSRIKRNKAPGHDKVPGELFKWLDQENRKVFLDAANACLQKEELQSHHMNAVVVSIYKKGDSSSLANYRPISLLNSCYKILAALVKERLDQGLDSWLTKTQYGFRKKRSTAQAIYIARRLQDLAEKSKSRSTLILLDWEKAFDKVSQSKMLETLHRLNIPTRLCNLIQSFYNDPQFKVSMGDDESTWRKQATGIRQGCPLSPYLFTIVMAALFLDVRRELSTPRQLQPLDGIFFSQVLYADDTLIFGANTHCINILLHAIERHSKYYGVNLNYGKCINLTANQRQSSVHFSQTGPGQGQLVPRKNSAMYLGTLLTDSFDNRAEVMNRLGDCVATCRRMKLFWNKANTSVKWKIQVFNAIVRSKLLYGLEAIQLTQTEISKLNAFQNRSLRRILKIPPTFIDRSYSNQRMYEEIRDQHGCKFEHFGETWRTAKIRLLGHLLRTSRDDPLYQVTFAADGLHPRETIFRRPGRPKQDWLIETYRDAYKRMYENMQFERENAAHLQEIKERATQRLLPFWSGIAFPKAFGLSW